MSAYYVQQENALGAKCEVLGARCVAIPRCDVRRGLPLRRPPAVWRAQQVRLQAGRCTERSVGQQYQPVVFRSGNVFTFERVAEVVLRFHERGSGDRKKVREIEMRLASEPF